MWEAKKWGEEPIFKTPMISTTTGNVYLYDFIQCTYKGDEIYGKVMDFFVEGNEVIEKTRSSWVDGMLFYHFHNFQAIKINSSIF